ncbi:hypothetical protein BST61_g4268 [Cercospora zeina]
MGPQVIQHPLARADGSTVFSDGLYTVIAGVNGPVDVQRRDELPEEAAVEVNLRPTAGVGGPRERWLETVVASVLKSILFVHMHPRTLIQVTLQVTNEPATKFRKTPTDISTLPALLNAAFLALTDGGLPLATTMSAVLAAVNAEGEVVVAPDEKTIKSGRSIHALAFDKDGEQLLDQSAGKFDLDVWSRVFDTAQQSCAFALASTGADATMTNGVAQGEPWLRQTLQEQAAGATTSDQWSLRRMRALFERPARLLQPLGSARACARIPVVMGGSKSNNASIQAYLTPVTSPVKSPAVETPVGDGFTAEELQEALKPKLQETWHPDCEYADMEISDLIAGPKAVTFMGRVANIFDVANSSRTPRSAKGCVKLCVKDGSGAITVRLWYAAHLPAIRLGSLVSVWVNHISNGENGMLSSSSAPLFTSIFPERDRNCHIMLHENSDDGKMYRTPLEYKENVPINGLMTLETFTNGGYDVVDAKLLVVVKSISAKRKVTRKDESVTQNINLQVHDDTGEATLGLWGTSASSPLASQASEHSEASMTTAREAWKPGETVLLLHAPGWKLGRNLYLNLTSTTTIDLNPAIPDTTWLRKWSLRLRTREALNPPFPQDIFSASCVRESSLRCLYTLGDLDELARNSRDPIETTIFQGYLSLVITDFQLVDYWKRHMLFSGECCSIPVYANALVMRCKGCEAVVPLRLNARIVGQVVDESGAVGCGKLVFSDEAWEGLLLGRRAEDVLRMDVEEVEDLHQSILFARVTVLFGWSGDETVAGGRICVLAVEA